MIRKHLVAFTLIFALLGGISPVFGQEETTPEAPVLVVTAAPDEEVTVIPLPEGNPPPEVIVVTPVEEGPSDGILAVLITAAATVLSIAIWGYATYKKMTVGQVWQQLPTPITQWGYPMLWGAAYQQALRTPEPQDDEALIRQAEMLGYKAEKATDGRVILISPPRT